MLSHCRRNLNFKYFPINLKKQNPTSYFIARNFSNDYNKKLDGLSEAPAGTLHFKRIKIYDDTNVPVSERALPHPIWDMETINSIPNTHQVPEGLCDKSAYYSVQLLRKLFDFFTGYNPNMRDYRQWVRRVVVLETVAGVPGMIGAMSRHMRSLRKMERDYGWIHTLLEEAENERMHLLVALTLLKPGPILRGIVMLTQALFFTAYSCAYAISPKFSHRFVGYLEEEAFHTYTALLSAVDKGKVPEFADSQAPFVARDYYQLPDGATLRDVFACIRADESHHRDVNHTFAVLPRHELNPFKPGH